MTSDYRCLCPACCATPSPMYSDAWKLTTEANLILQMDLAGRRKYLNMLKGDRRSTLEAEIKKQWNASRKQLTNSET